MEKWGKRIVVISILVTSAGIAIFDLVAGKWLWALFIIATTTAVIRLVFFPKVIYPQDKKGVGAMKKKVRVVFCFVAGITLVAGITCLLSDKANLGIVFAALGLSLFLFLGIDWILGD